MTTEAERLADALDAAVRDDMNGYGYSFHRRDMTAAAALLRTQAAALAEREGALRSIEVIGVQCADTGVCYHNCSSECFRKTCCEPLSLATWLRADWTLAAAPSPNKEQTK